MVTERELLERARKMRRNPTEWEVRLRRSLSSSQTGYKFRRKHVIFPYICDFFCPAKGVIVEIDGDSHDVIDDGLRDRKMADGGYETLRFTNLDVRDAMEGVIKTIVDRLAKRSDRWSGLPHPNPSPEGGGLSE